MSSINKFEGKNFLVTGASETGYGGAIVKEASHQGANIFVTSTQPNAKKEESVTAMGGKLLETPVNLNVTTQENDQRNWEQVQQELNNLGVETLDGMVLAHAGGLPMNREMLNLLKLISEQRLGLNDLPNGIIENILYVDALSYGHIIDWSKGLMAKDAPIIATSYSGKMIGYIIAPIKRILEKIIREKATEGHNTLALALPEAITPATKIFKNIALIIVHNYLKEIDSAENEISIEEDEMHQKFASTGNIEKILEKVRNFFEVFSLETLKEIEEENPQRALQILREFNQQLQKTELEISLNTISEIISEFVRKKTAQITVEQFLNQKAFNPGETRKLTYTNLLVNAPGESIDTSEETINISTLRETPIKLDPETCQRLLAEVGYGPKFSLVSTAEISEDGKFARGTFEVPQGPILPKFIRDHFTHMPLMPGVIQQEAANQLAVLAGAYFDNKNMPLLTGLKNIQFDTMVLPGDKIQLEIEIIHNGKREKILRFKIEVNGKVSTGEVNAVSVPKTILVRDYQKRQKEKSV